MFSLRLRGHLLYGLCRIYYKKVEFLYADCTKVLVKIKNVRIRTKATTFTLHAPHKYPVQAPQETFFESTVGSIKTCASAPQT